MRVLMVVQQLEESHWLRGFIVAWVRALAARVEHVTVITLEQGEAVLPSNVAVHTMGKEHGYGRARELANFYRGLARFSDDVDVIFSHMTPRYTWLAAPFALARRKPQVLWYTHPKVSLELRLATAVARRVVSASETSFPLKTPKLRVLGHGIDTDFFTPGANTVLDHPPVVLLVGRLTRIKNHGALLRALADEVDAQAVLIGEAAGAFDSAYLETLKAEARRLGVESRVAFTGALPAGVLRYWYQRATAAVNLTPAGSFDKTVLESLACGLPTVVSHHGFDALLGDAAPRLRIDSPDDAAGLAQRLRQLIGLSLEDRRALMAPLRERVAAAHGLPGLMGRLLGVFEELKGQ